LAISSVVSPLDESQNTAAETVMNVVGARDRAVITEPLAIGRGHEVGFVAAAAAPNKDQPNVEQPD
jgi:hypothetical protein